MVRAQSHLQKLDSLALSCDFRDFNRCSLSEGNALELVTSSELAISASATQPELVFVSNVCCMPSSTSYFHDLLVIQLKLLRDRCR